MANLKCTVSGSFRRYLGEIESKIAQLNSAGWTVLSPGSTRSIKEEDGFVFLEGDGRDPCRIEQEHLHAIRQSNCLYVVNPTGYIGPSSTLEIGYAIALGIPVVAQEVPTEPILRMFVKTEACIAELKQLLTTEVEMDIPRRADLAVLQAYIRKVVALRGFHNETLRDVALLLVEEVGELAKAIRKDVGLKLSSSSVDAHKNLGHELADCFIYLLDIANLANVDLDQAFREKEAINTRKTWHSYSAG